MNWRVASSKHLDLLINVGEKIISVATSCCCRYIHHCFLAFAAHQANRRIKMTIHHMATAECFS